MDRSLIVAVALGAAACTPAPGEGAATAPRPVTPIATDAGAVATSDAAVEVVSTDAGEVGARDAGALRHACDVRQVPPALAEMPCVPDDFYVRVREHGFSKDGSHFGHCSSGCEVCGIACTIVELRTGRTTKLKFSDEHRGATDAQHAADARHDVPLTAVLRKHYGEWQELVGPTPRTFRGPFRHPDVVFSSESAYDPKTGKATIAFGGRVGDGPVVRPWTKSFGPHDMWSYQPPVSPQLKGAERDKALVEVRDEMRSMFTLEPPVVADIDVSADGKYLGVVFMTSGVRFAEYSDMLLVETDKAVARLANEGGFALHRQQEWPRAAKLFARAASLAPDEPLYAYNEACARARTGDEPRAEDALRRAVTDKKSGPSLAARAKKDEDLASVRASAWFRAVVGP